MNDRIKCGFITVALCIAGLAVSRINSPNSALTSRVFELQVQNEKLKNSLVLSEQLIDQQLTQLQEQQSEVHALYLELQKWRQPL